MDIALLRTFLEVARQRHFGRAADRLHVTQSAVSARIKLLETTLGLELFSRKRNDIQLTLPGQRLMSHAETIVRGWQRARQELALEPQVTAIAVGFSPDLWEGAMRDWTLATRQGHTDIALQLEMHTPQLLSERVISGGLDIALLFEPPQAPGMEIHALFDIRLLLVASQADISLQQAFDSNYILVDWGLSFALRHASLFGERPAPMLRVSSGSMALGLLLQQAGAAYLPEPSVRSHLQQGLLHRVADAPEISRRVFAIHRSGRQDEERLLALIDSMAG
jgi:DNA-binding transcriptional LysR family regulator